MAIQNGEIAGIIVETEVKNSVSTDLLGKYFSFDNGVYKIKKTVPTLNTVNDIRSYLYKNGFWCDGRHYVRFKRSSGSARVGKCLFIDEKLYPKMHKWEMCGLKIGDGEETDLASLEAYISLTTSSIMGTVDILPQNILVIDDFESKFEDEVMATELGEDKRLKTSPKKVTIKNKIWDGQSLMDKSVFYDWREKEKELGHINPPLRGMLLLRSRFFKSCCFNTNIKKWFRDNGITEVSQLKGYTRASSIDDIKLITTPSSIKYLKFGTLDMWLDKAEPSFGVVKYEKKTHFFDGRYVQTHYQLLNTLQMDEAEVEEFMRQSYEYIDNIKTDPAFLRHAVKYTYRPPEEEFTDQPPLSNNEIIYKMLGVNDKFARTKIYIQFRDNLIKSMIKNLRKGHVLVRGNYSTLCGNPIEMLQAVIGTFDGSSYIEKGTVHSLNFDDGEDLLCSRSPHVAVGNILLTKNRRYELIDRYMNPSGEILFINSIGENNLERLSGADFDSDTVMVTNNRILFDVAKKNYHRFLVPTKLVESVKLKRYYTPEQQADLDIKTSVNKIGEIINLSAELLSTMWDKVNRGADGDEIMELYADIAQLDVMSNLEIDSAKRENPADNVWELKRLKKKYDIRNKKGRHVRPLFFKYIDDFKGYNNNYHVYREFGDEYEKVFDTDSYSEAYDLAREEDSLKVYKGHMDYQFMVSTMDMIDKSINRFKRKMDKRYGNTYEMQRGINQRIEFEDCLLPLSYFDVDKLNRVQVYSLCDDIIPYYNSRFEYIYNNYPSYLQRVSLLEELQCDYINKIRSIQFNKDSMRWLLNIANMPIYSGISNAIWTLCFGILWDKFKDLIICSSANIEILKEIKTSGVYTNLYYIYDLMFTKEQKNAKNIQKSTDIFTN